MSTGERNIAIDIFFIIISKRKVNEDDDEVWVVAIITDKNKEDFLSLAVSVCPNMFYNRSCLVINYSLNIFVCMSFYTKCLVKS